MPRRVISLDYAVFFVACIHAVEFVHDLDGIRYTYVMIIRERHTALYRQVFRSGRISGFERLDSARKHQGFSRRDFLSPFKLWR